MKLLYVIAGIMTLIFGIMEIYKDHASTLGFILIVAGVVLLSLQLFRWRSEHLDDFDSEFHIDLSSSNDSGSDFSGDGGGD